MAHSVFQKKAAHLLENGFKVGKISFWVYITKCTLRHGCVEQRIRRISENWDRRLRSRGMSLTGKRNTKAKSPSQGKKKHLSKKNTGVEGLGHGK
jgi:hypothetical protein